MNHTGVWRNLRHDMELRLSADGRGGEWRPRDIWRIGRRRFKHRVLQSDLLRQPRYFCLNSGCCGSTYLIRLLDENGWIGVYHEKVPDFNELGVAHYDDPINENRLASLLRYTRWDVFLEANNRLFSLALPLHRAFPGARFVHLHRDGRQAVCSALSRPDVEGYLGTNVRFQGTLAGDHRMRPLERFCHYWNNMNRRILDDLARLQPAVGPWLSLSFDDLVSGRLESLESFVTRPIVRRQRPAVNRGITGSQGRYPDFEDWSTADQNTFRSICGETMRRLAYPI